jgi:hypothetical protein
MAEDPANRHASADELSDELERYLRPRRPLAWLACLTLLLGAVIGTYVIWPSPQSAPVTFPQRQQLVQVVQRSVEGADRVFTPTTLRDLQRLSPFQPGDRIIFSCDLPEHWLSSALLLDTHGQLHELSSRKSGAEAGLVRHHFPARGSWRVSGSQGTIVVVVCASPGPEPPLAEARRIITEASASAKDALQLPPTVLLHLHNENIEPFGEIPRGGDPHGSGLTRVWDWLDLLRSRLQGKCDFFCGLAVPQEQEQ